MATCEGIRVFSITRRIFFCRAHWHRDRQCFHLCSLSCWKREQPFIKHLPHGRCFAECFVYIISLNPPSNYEEDSFILILYLRKPKLREDQRLALGHWSSRRIMTLGLSYCRALAFHKTWHLPLWKYFARSFIIIIFGLKICLKIFILSCRNH